LLQDVWLRVVAGAPGPIASPLAYLHRIANNLVLDMRRSERRSGQRDLAWQEGRDEVEAPLGERALIAREQLRRVETDMAKLGERVATVFRRYRLDNVSQREIAAELGISLSAVEKDLQRAYRALVEIRRRDDAT
jgi:RNA polymerase sigma-70 factor (ECF subfamily)